MKYLVSENRKLCSIDVFVKRIEEWELFDTLGCLGSDICVYNKRALIKYLADLVNSNLSVTIKIKHLYDV